MAEAATRRPGTATPAPALVPWAEALGAALPPLVVQAERVAATVMQGVHGRRQAGQGDSFWQFRPYVPGDAPSRVDWRQSAKSDRLYVRETEWEAAQTVALWVDSGAWMDWRHSPELPTKRIRADLLALSLASLLFRGGERVRIFGVPRAHHGRGALRAMAATLARQKTPPDDPALPRHTRAVMLGDFLGPLDETHRAVGAFSSRGIRGTMVQVLDPAEETLPFSGRVRFAAVQGSEELVVPRVEGVRALYAERLAQHRAGLTAIAASTGWKLLTHRTDAPPEAALLALWQGLAPATR